MRALRMKKEVLSELSAAELGAVGAGTVGDLKTRFCPTDPCITEPVTQLKCLLSLGPDACIS